MEENKNGTPIQRLEFLLNKIPTKFLPEFIYSVLDIVVHHSLTKKQMIDYTIQKANCRGN